MARRRSPSISSCFAALQGKKMIELARLRYGRMIPTVDLMQSRKTPRDKMLVAAVAMLDVPEKALVALLWDQPDQIPSVLARRRCALRRLRRNGIRVLPKAA